MRDLLDGRTPELIFQIGTAFDDIAAHLRDGLEPAPGTVTDHVALHLIIERARALPAERPDLLDGRHLLLPASSHDDDALERLSELHTDHRNLADGTR